MDFRYRLYENVMPVYDLHRDKEILVNLSRNVIHWVRMLNEKTKTYTDKRMLNNDRNKKHMIIWNSKYYLKRDCEEKNGVRTPKYQKDTDNLRKFSNDYKPTPRFNWIVGEKAKGKLFCGVELEFNEIWHEVLQDIDETSWADHCIYAKSDGSLSNGTEFVTHPFSWDHYKEKISKKIANLCKTIEEKGGKTTNETGIHVHLDAEYCDDIYFDILQFFNSNNNQEILEKIAGRKSNKWALACDEKRQLINRLNNTRYLAVNLTEHTAEIRIFRSSLETHHTLGRIEFCFAVVDWLKNKKSRGTDILDFITRSKTIKNSKKYKSLNQLVVEKQI